MATSEPLNLDELQALADAATPRPWFVEGRIGPTRDDPGWRALATTESYALATSPENVFVRWVDIDNLRYAAAACNAGPALIRRVRELEGALRMMFTTNEYGWPAWVASDDQTFYCPFCGRRPHKRVPDEWQNIVHEPGCLVLVATALLAPPAQAGEEA